MKNKIDFDSQTLALITGKYVKVKTQTVLEDGTIITRVGEEFRPNGTNKYAPISSLVNSLSKLKTKAEVYIMEGLHPKMMEIDYSIFTKTQIDKDILKLTKKEHKKDLIKAGKNPKKHMNIFS